MTTTASDICWPFLRMTSPRRAVDPPGKADQSQELSLVDGAECDAIELFFPVTKNYRPPLQSYRHDANRVDNHERRPPENRRPQFFVLEIVIQQGQPLTDDRQYAQLEEVSDRERHKKHNVRQVNQTVDPENLISHELVHKDSHVFRYATELDTSQLELRQAATAADVSNVAGECPRRIDRDFAGRVLPAGLHKTLRHQGRPIAKKCRH
jgi:hypothetical protein